MLKLSPNYNRHLLAHLAGKMQNNGTEILKAYMDTNWSILVVIQIIMPAHHITSLYHQVHFHHKSGVTG